MGWNYQRKTDRVYKKYKKRLRARWKCGRWKVSREFEDDGTHYYTLRHLRPSMLTWKLTGVSTDVAWFLENAKDFKRSEKIINWLTKVEKEASKYDKRRKTANAKHSNEINGLNYEPGEFSEFSYYATYHLTDHPATV